jgi:hypothetical protein
MKTKLIYGSIVALVIIALVSALFILFSPESGDQVMTQGEGAVPERVSQLGPYARNIRLMEKVGAYDLALEARVLHMKKTKVLGFDSALYRRVVTRDARLTVYRDGRKVLEATKERLILPPGMKVIEMESPRVLYPGGMKDLRKIRVDKGKKVLRLYRAGRVETWKLDG